MAELERISLNLLRPSGSCTPLVVRRMETISQVKDRVAEVIPACRHDMELLHNDLRLDNKQTILQCGINEGDALTVLVRQLSRIDFDEAVQTLNTMRICGV